MQCTALPGMCSIGITKTRDKIYMDLHCNTVITKPQKETNAHLYEAGYIYHGTTQH